MEMDKLQNNTYPPQGTRRPQGSASDSDIVPVAQMSSSDEGPRMMLPTGVIQDTATAEETKKQELSAGDLPPISPVVTPTIGDGQFDKDTKLLHTHKALENNGTTSADASLYKEGDIINTADKKINTDDKQFDASSIISSDMDWETSQKASKRKLEAAVNPTSQEDSEEDEEISRPKLRARAGNRKRPPIEKRSNKQEELLDPDSEDTSKKDTMSTQTQEQIGEIERKEETEKKEEGEKKEEIDRKEEIEKKIGRPKKKTRAVDPIEAEKKILEKTGFAPEKMDSELLQGMTASDISAQALDYLEVIEAIRNKCGRLQGGLSGELKRRTSCLEEMIRALQVKAESQGDPEFLRKKINELLEEIRRNKREEEKRSREVSELREVIKELRKENKDMREEMRKIRESVENRENLERRSEREPQKDRRELDRERREGNLIEKKVRNLPGRYLSHVESPSHVEGPVRDAGPSYAEEELTHEGKMFVDEDFPPVMRPSLGGKRIPVPENIKKVNRLEIVNRQIESLTKIRNKICLVDKEKEEGKEEEAIKESTGRGSKLRIKENIQLVPPRKSKRIEEEEIMQETEDRNRTITDRKDIKEQEWTQVIRKGRGKEKERGDKVQREEMLSRKTRREEGNRGTDKKKGRRIPKTAAISIKGSTTNFSYAEALMRARKQISLEDLKIDNTKIRKGINGSTIIEIAGADSNRKADQLATKLQDVLQQEALVTRPTVKGELRITGIDESVNEEEIRIVIAKEGDCDMKEIKVGKIRITRSGLGMVWVKCPLKAAIAVAKTNKIKLGWTIARTELLKSRPLQCYRCWSQGHVRDNCKSSKDFSRCCYRCGREGHLAVACQNQPKCAICLHLKIDANHRVGSAICEGIKISQKRRNQILLNMSKETSDNTDTNIMTDTPTRRLECESMEI